MRPSPAASRRIAATWTGGVRSGSSAGSNELGVDRAEIRAALASGADADGEGGHDELQVACDLLARRFPVPPETPRDLERALGFLVRKGYALELAHDALRRHAGATIEG